MTQPFVVEQTQRPVTADEKDYKFLVDAVDLQTAHRAGAKLVNIGARYVTRIPRWDEKYFVKQATHHNAQTLLMFEN